MVLTVLIAAGLIVVLLWRALVAARALAHSRARLIDYTNDLERAKDEEHRLRIQAAEANHAKSNFLAMMSHELRTPLNSVLGFGELIVQGRDNPQLRERSPEYAEDIVSSGTHLLSVLNDILDLSRIEAGRFELNEESFDLDVVVRSAARMVAQRVKQSGVALVTPPTGFGLYGDPRAIKQILVNLLSNAAKFTRAGRIMVDAWLEGDWLALRVSDTGIGMDPEGLARALQPFGQAESGHARPAEGTGLGLNIVRELARLHGGEMDIETAPGEGTTVVIRLPRERLIAWSDETDGRLRAFG